MVCSGDRFLIVLEYEDFSKTLVEKSYQTLNYEPGGGLFASNTVYIQPLRGGSSDLIYLYNLDLESGMLKEMGTQIIAHNPIQISHINNLNRTNILLAVFTNSTDIYI